MRAVLGIDAAWTDKNPSGVALAKETEDGWMLCAVRCSYGEFCRKGLGDGYDLPDNAFDAPSLIRASEALAKQAPNLIAVDMPLSKSGITKRRPSDDCLSSEFGRYWCATHSPSKDRPGRVGKNLFEGFVHEKYEHCKNLQELSRYALHGLIEVYPHPALLTLIEEERRIELFDSDKRLPYKLHRAAKYWKKVRQPERRRAKLLEVWRAIVAALDRQLQGADRELGPMPSPESSLKDWKAYEDKLDAVICAWVAIAALEGHAKAYGDCDSAIWVPTPTSLR